LVQEEQKERQGKDQETPEEDKHTNGVDDPSLEEEPEAPDQEEQIAEEEEEESEGEMEGEDESAEEAEEIAPATGELAPRRGCFWGCLFPIVIIILVFATVIAIVHVRWGDSISSWMRHRIIANTQINILGDLPDDMDEKEIKAAFEDVKTALDKDMIDAEILDDSIGVYQDATKERSSQKKQAINDLMEGLDAAIIKPE